MLDTPIKKIIAGILALFIVVPIVMLIYTLLPNRTPEGYEISIVRVPSYAKVLLDNEVVKKNTVYLKPGNYTFKASYDGFDTLTRKVEIVDSNRPIVLPLAPNTDEARQWVKDNADKYTEAEAIEGQRLEESGIQQAERYPLISRLPYNAEYYSISYSLESGKKIYIRIDSKSPIGRQVAVQKIRDWGFEPTDYKIVFAGLINPFDNKTTEGGL